MKFILIVWTVLIVTRALELEDTTQGHIEAYVVSIAPAAAYNAGEEDGTWISVPECTDEINESCIPVVYQ